MQSSRLRVLTIALIFSGALNIGLVMALVFSTLEDASETAALPHLGSQVSALPTNLQTLKSMLKLSFSELLTYLTNREQLEEGYTKRDLALSALVASHFFHLEGALSVPPQARLVALSPEENIALFPGLTDEQYDAIIRFAYQEKWPLTSKGLFQMLKKLPKGGRDPSLCEAFFRAPEFHALQVLFQKTQTPQDSHVLLDLAMEGPWESICRFREEQEKTLDLSVEKRRSLLFAYLAYRSPTAAALLLKTDFLFAKTRLADEGILLLLDLLQEKSPAGERLSIDLLHSPRTDAVWKAAAEKLYAFAGEEPPSPFDLQAALSRFGSPSAAVAAPPPKPSARLREHIVQEGESLWKISRQYKVSVDELIQHNSLERDRLLPGMVLSIPQGTGSEPPR